MHECSALHDDSNALAEVHVRSELSKVSPMTEKPLVSRAGRSSCIMWNLQLFSSSFREGSATEDP